MAAREVFEVARTTAEVSPGPLALLAAWVLSECWGGGWPAGVPREPEQRPLGADAQETLDRLKRTFDNTIAAWDRTLEAFDTQPAARRRYTAAAHRDVTAEALVTLRTLFTRRYAEGIEMTVRAAGDPANSDVMRASMVALATDLVAATEQ